MVVAVKYNRKVAIKLRPVDALVDLTGGVGEEIDIRSAQAQIDLASGRLWSQLLRFKQEGFLLGAGSPSGSDVHVSSSGIVQWHAYSILQVHKVDGNKLVQIRNPWANEVEWNGPWSDSSPEWTDRMKHKLKHVPQVVSICIPFTDVIWGAIANKLKDGNYGFSRNGAHASNGDAAMATRPKTKPKDGNDGEDVDMEKLRSGLNSAIIREKPNIKWNDVAGLESAKQSLQEAVILPDHLLDFP
ncbi:Calpain catalytic domain-containing protein [Abeliophyllum distichum]|uniref:Calpain catalytic domain-containing protein n=1 Tax=Abeliophyllum distichum TaxID=126358 RepID=A0ABD1PP08_9LAMI